MKTCTIDGCEKPLWARGYCTNHYALWRRNGKPEIVREFKGEYIKDGYRYIMVGYRHYEPEHRLVMERHLGRKLESKEHVHHKDGNTLNNAIDNLQVLSRARHMAAHRRDLANARKASGSYSLQTRGEGNPRNVLKADQVIEIRQRHAAGRGSLTSLGREYGVSKCTIYDIVHRRSWTYLE